MTDSGFSGVPPRPSPRELSFEQSLIELKAKIIEIRGELRVQRVRETLEGEIVRNNPDGTTVIRTDKGEMTVVLRGRERPPEGARVEIDIPPGNPPRQITIRPLPDAPPPDNAQKPPPALTADVPAPPPHNLPRLEIRSAQELARQTAQPAPPDQPRPVDLRPGDIIRLLPLSGEIIRTEPPPPALTPQATPVQTLLPQDNAGVNPQIPALTPPDQMTPPSIRPAVPPGEKNLAQALLPNEAGQTAPPSVFLQPVLQKGVPSTPVFQALPSPENTPDHGAALPILPDAIPFKVKSFTPLDVKVQAIFPPGLPITDAPLAVKPQASPGLPEPLKDPVNLLTGKISGVTPQGFPVLSLFTQGAEPPLNFMIAAPTANLPAGTQIRLVPQPGQPQAPDAPFTPYAFFSTFAWPAMEELDTVLQQAVQQSARTLAATMPNAAMPSRLPAAALFFIAAVRSGDLPGWLGDKTTDTLRRIGKSDLLTRLTRDLSGLQRTAAEPAGEWRATALPLFWGGEMHKLILHYRHDEKDGKDESDHRRGTRFVFDLSLDRMGPVQLDGLHRPGRLNLIVRTTNPIGPAMKQTMRKTYADALEQASIAGELSFQDKPEQFIAFDNRPENVGTVI